MNIPKDDKTKLEEAEHLTETSEVTAEDWGMWIEYFGITGEPVMVEQGRY